ncbi:MAG: hypothetical protein N2C14_05965 [Planctomycetales bacterium]
MNTQSDPIAAMDEITRESLREIVDRHGTPAYAFDLRRLRAQAEKLRRNLPAAEILYSLKSNASLGICDVLADCGIGADVASAGEFATALEAGFPPERIFVAGPFKLPETVARLRETPQAVVSVDSESELRMLASSGLSNKIVLRLRPDFGSCAVVPAGSESRFGFTRDDLDCLPDFLGDCPLEVIGFHVFAGSQVLDADEVISHLTQALDLSLRAAESIGVVPTLINLGGGLGTPYAADDQELDLNRVGEALSRLASRAAPARLVLELGRYLVAQSGWYLTSVLGAQTNQGRPAVVVDGGVHQRADMCGLCLRTKARPPIALGRESSSFQPTDVLGCLSLPDDVLIESASLPPLSPGDALAFPNAGAYGIWSSPAIFHGSPLPAEAGFDETGIHLMRERLPASSVLNGQRRVPSARAAST